MSPTRNTPQQSSYDVVIVGGAIMGSSTAWFLTENPDFDGSVLVVERDPSYEFASTALSNSCVRQQFSTGLNVQISQFTADYVKNLRSHLGDDARVPELAINSFGYLYLANTKAHADSLRQGRAVQAALGVQTKLLSAEELGQAYPFYTLDDIVLGSINTVDEGNFDGYTIFEWWRRLSRERGVEFLSNEVVDIALGGRGDHVTGVTLASGERVTCGQLVNASGTRAAQTAAMAGISLPVEPRKRYSWIFKAKKPLDRPLPLTIDPSGVHFRENGDGTYLCGAKPKADGPVAFDDFAMDHSIWQDYVWPILATRIPQFDAVKVTAEWAGHYAFNTLDQNAITGPHPEVANFFFLNGFSGHGLQQSPAMGRATSELLTYGTYRTLDLSPFHYERVRDGRAMVEGAVI